MHSRNIPLLAMLSFFFPILTLVTSSALGQRTQSPRGERENEAKLEAAIESAVIWIAKHQSADGGWSFDHRGGKCNGRCGNQGTLPTTRNAATAMALLPLLGAGETHKKGKYKSVVYRGLSYLGSRAQKKGNTASYIEKGGTMYSHGLCAIVLCEAYGISGDEALREPAQRALNFIVEAQDPVGGGWRYQPRAPGDTSVTGWQLSAIHAGRSAKLNVPEKTVLGALKFLNSVQAEQGAKYGYVAPGAGLGTTSIGLLARQRLGGLPNKEPIQRGLQFLMAEGPSAENLYYDYYASHAFSEAGGELAKTWNERMRDLLLQNQNQGRGHDRGSWYMKGDHGSDRGGRLYCTSLATLTLEMHFRRLAIFQPTVAK